MVKKQAAKHKWTFSSRFRAGAFGWKSSKLACQRVREAVSEIKKAAKSNPSLGVEGTVLFVEKLAPSIEHVDSSSGGVEIPGGGDVVYRPFSTSPPHGPTIDIIKFPEFPQKNLR